ncbi:MAG: PAS domain-containing sensor histidine kinase [Bacteroidetes bacterium]|nr:PAS domain-containing sensor histidine kinase [Bacteroidota bacterium]
MSDELNHLKERIDELEKENAILKIQLTESLNSKELCVRIFEDFPVLIWRARLDKLCDYFNKKWLEFTGRTMEQEVGNGWTEGVHPDDFDACLNTYVTSFDKRESFVMEYRLKNNLGEYRWILDYGQPFYDLDNTFLGYIGACFDITEIENAKSIIKEQNKELQKLNSTKNLFISILGHDLRDPFNSLLVLSNLLKDNLRNYDIDKIETFVKNINEVSISTINLLEELLLWVKTQTGQLIFEPQELNLPEICNEILGLLDLSINKKNILIKKIFPLDLVFYGDKNMVKFIIRDIVSNAIKFTNPGGQITIAAQQKNENVEISIEDNGVGMTAIQKQKLFDISKMQSTLGTKKEVGTGLGLIICKEFVDKHSGKIGVESEKEKGTIFKFSLPSKVEE